MNTITPTATEEIRFPLRHLYFYLTDGCNLRCRHCWMEPRYQVKGGSPPVLDVDLFRSIVDQAGSLGVAAIKLTGGEPLIHPGIGDILECVAKAGLSLAMETNGMYCTPEFTRRIMACERPFVAVSLDGAEPDIHDWMRGVGGAFRGAVQGIRNLVGAGLRPQVIMSVVRKNKDQMERLVRLAETLGAGSVKFNVVQPTSRGERMHEAGETLSIKELVELGQWVETDLSRSTGLRIAYSHPLAFRPLSRMFHPETGDGCHVCAIFGILGILADGSYALCGIGQALPDMVFGHAAEDSLEDVWNNSPVLNQLREGLPSALQGICGECLMRGICLGSCVAQNYYRSKSLWAPYWYCDEADKEGLFPESRKIPRTRVVGKAVG